MYLNANIGNRRMKASRQQTNHNLNLQWKSEKAEYIYFQYINSYILGFRFAPYKSCTKSDTMSEQHCT